jgi:hypothetical protein
MREMSFQRHKNFKNREGATACPQTYKDVVGAKKCENVDW